MSVDVREMREGVVDAEETMANAATGAIVSVVDAATDPVGAVRKTVRRLEKRGGPVNRRLERRVERAAEDAADTTVDVVSGNLAERVTLAGIRVVKNRARRRDVVGDVLFRGVELVHKGLNAYAGELSKFQNATEPPTRNGERSSSPARRSARGRTRRAAGTSRRSTNRSTRTSSRAARTRTTRQSA